MKKLSILGSTGSIGTSTLEVVRHLGEEVKIIALATRQNIDLLQEQIQEFRPKIAVVFDTEKARELQKRLPSQEILAGIEGVIAAAAHTETNFVISAMSGVIGLKPTVAAIKAGKDIGLANKEVLVSGGELVMSLVKKHGIKFIPVDSEHSAIYQCLAGESLGSIRRLILTASGGPFRDFTAAQLAQVTLDQALKHPNWSMGPKITIDSSTLMNKGLEIIEARWLFDLPVDKIEVVIHPQSIIHSFVEFIDGSIKAQLSEPSMLIPIQYALTAPNRKPGILPPFDFLERGVLQFYSPDTEKFPCLALAIEALKAGGSFPCTLNAANEALVSRFLQGGIGWQEIGQKLELMMSRHTSVSIKSVEDLFNIDQAARKEAATI